MTDKALLKRLINTAAGRIPAELVLKNCRVVDVYAGEITEGDIAFCGGLIAGVGRYGGEREIDAGGRFASPGLIDSHIHVESSYLCPEELSRLLVPCGTAALIADPHEIANVLGLRGLRYMQDAGRRAALEIRWMMPSCVPATPFEHAGAELDAAAMKAPLDSGGFLGLGEFMDYPGVIAARDDVLDKLTAAKRRGMPMDGHSPGVSGRALNAYAAAGIRTDHECASPEELRDRISRGMYVLLRQGSACHNLRTLLRGVTPENSRRCLLCTDDCQPSTILGQGHLNLHLRICAEEGLDPVSALRMATLNAAECYGLRDRGAIAPGLRGDVVLFDDLREFRPHLVILGGREAAENGRYLHPVTRQDIGPVRGSLHIRDLTAEKLRIPLKSDLAHVIGIVPGGVVTRRETARVARDGEGCFRYDPSRDIVKIVVAERHRGTGSAAAALLGGYGMRAGAIALSVAHDSHNVIAAGVSDGEILHAVSELTAQDGGIVLVREGRVLERMPMPIAGLMTDQTGEWVDERLSRIHALAHEALGVSPQVEPVMTLCFMSLPVIPALKLTDTGLFDVERFQYIPVDASGFQSEPSFRKNTP